MTSANIAVCGVALVGSGLTLFSGFGLGALLMPAFALFFPIAVAVSAPCCSPPWPGRRPWRLGGATLEHGLVRGEGAVGQGHSASCAGTVTRGTSPPSKESWR